MHTHVHTTHARILNTINKVVLTKEIRHFVGYGGVWGFRIAGVLWLTLPLK